MQGLHAAVMESVLVDLLQAIKEGDQALIDAEVQNAVEILGYDPAEVLHDYEVSLTIGVEAKDEVEAVKNFMSLIESSELVDWVYVVNGADCKDVAVDAYHIEW